MAVVLKRQKPISRPAQGDIYTEIRVPLVGQVTINDSGEAVDLKGDILLLDYAVVLSQECDIEQDYNDRDRDEGIQDKHVQALLVAPAYLAETLKAGEHLLSAGFKMQKMNTEMWRVVKNNKNERYHFIEQCPALNVPDLVVDFKHMYTLSRSYFYQAILNNSYRASLAYLSRELLSQRFCNFLSRIGLPDEPEELDVHFGAMRNAATPSP